MSPQKGVGMAGDGSGLHCRCHPKVLMIVSFSPDAKSGLPLMKVVVLVGKAAVITSAVEATMKQSSNIRRVVEYLPCPCPTLTVAPNRSNCKPIALVTPCIYAAVRCAHLQPSRSPIFSSVNIGQSAVR